MSILTFHWKVRRSGWTYRSNYGSRSQAEAKKWLTYSYTHARSLLPQIPDSIVHSWSSVHLGTVDLLWSGCSQSPKSWNRDHWKKWTIGIHINDAKHTGHDSLEPFLHKWNGPGHKPDHPILPQDSHRKHPNWSHYQKSDIETLPCHWRVWTRVPDVGWILWGSAVGLRWQLHWSLHWVNPAINVVFPGAASGSTDARTQS